MSLRQKLNRIFRIQVGEHQPDKYLIGVIFVILVFGLISLTSAVQGGRICEIRRCLLLCKHQLFGLTIGLFAFWILSRIDYRVWKKYAFYFLVFSISFAFALHSGLISRLRQSAQLDQFFGYSLQPSEFVKLSFFYLAAWLESRKKNLGGSTQHRAVFGRTRADRSLNGPPAGYRHAVDRGYHFADRLFCRRRADLAYRRDHHLRHPLFRAHDPA